MIFKQLFQSSKNSKSINSKIFTVFPLLFFSLIFNKYQFHYKIYIMELLPVDCPKVPENFHFKLRQRFLNKLRSVEPHLNNSLSFYKGISTIPKNYDDIEYLVEQESTFWYFFGVKQADCFAIIHHDTGKTVLFVPELSEDYKLWMVVKSKEQLKQQYKVDQVKFTKDIRSYLEEVKPSSIYLFSGVDSDSGLKVEEPNDQYHKGFTINRETLWPIISNLRAIKTPEQIQLIRYVCRVTSEAEKISAKSAKPGLLQNQLHSVFQFQHSTKSGSLQLGFNSICSSGRDCATLHYIQNDKVIQPNQMVLLDLGGRWYGYVADQAMTFPVSGKFNDKQRHVYTAVLEAQKAVKSQVKPGVKWDEMHLLAQKILLEHLIKMGIVNNYPLQQLEKERIGAIFFPHGLGHLFGLKVHDLGGYTDGPLRSTEKGLSKLRTRRVLEEGMCITVEPGLYFIDFIIEKSLSDPNIAKYLNKEKIDEYKEVGGVRLQDDIVITKDGYQLLSSLPRQIQDVEKMLAK